MPHGQTSKSSHAAQLDIMKLETIVSNVLPHYSGMLSAENVNHAHKDTSTTQLWTDVIVMSHVKPQDKSTQPPDNVNALLIKRVTEEFGVLLTSPANAHQNFHCGMESIVSFAQLELNSIHKKSNVITVLMDSSETTTVTHVSQDFECDPFIATIVLKYLFLRTYKNRRIVNFEILLVKENDKRDMFKNDFLSTESSSWEVGLKKIVSKKEFLYWFEFYLWINFIVEYKIVRKIQILKVEI